MPFALIIIGLILVVTGAKDTYQALGQYVIADFTGAGNFLYWIAAIFIVGAIGYVPDIRGPSRLFLLLILLSFVLANQGVFAQFKNALAQGPVPPQQTAVATPSSIPVQSGSASGSPVSTTTGIASFLGSIF